MSELKPCPFCGGKADIDNSSYGEWVCCDECGATSIAKSWNSDTDINEAWNNRTTDRLKEENKELRAFLESLQLDVSNEIKLEQILSKQEANQC